MVERRFLNKLSSGEKAQETSSKINAKLGTVRVMFRNLNTTGVMRGLMIKRGYLGRKMQKGDKGYLKTNTVSGMKKL